MGVVGFDGVTEYICTYCGKKIRRTKNQGRPDPGNCPRKPKDASGHMKPHTWRINRRYQ